MIKNFFIYENLVMYLLTWHAFGDLLQEIGMQNIRGKKKEEKNTDWLLTRVRSHA